MNKIIVVGNIYDDTNKTRQNGRVYSGGGICRTLEASNFGHEVWVIYDKGDEDLGKSDVYLSEAGKRYVLSSKRGMCTDFNAEICQTLTARGQSNDTGSFISPDIKKVTKSRVIGGGDTCDD